MSVASLLALSAKAEAYRQLTSESKARQLALPIQAMNPEEIPQALINAIETVKKLNSFAYQKDLNFNKAYYAINISYDKKINFYLNTEIAVYYFIKSLNHLNPKQKEHSFRQILKKCIKSNNFKAFDRFIQIIRNSDDHNLDNILVCKDGVSILENLLYYAAKEGSLDILNYLYELDNNLINLKAMTSVNLIDDDTGLAYDNLIELPILKVAIQNSHLNNYCQYNIQNINYLLSLHPNIIYKKAIHDAISFNNPQALRALLKKNPQLINVTDDKNLSPLDLIDFEAALHNNAYQVEMLRICHEYKEFITDLEKKSLIEQIYADIFKRKTDDDFSDDEIWQVFPKYKNRK